MKKFVLIVLLAASGLSFLFPYLNKIGAFSTARCRVISENVDIRMGDKKLDEYGVGDTIYLECRQKGFLYPLGAKWKVAKGIFPKETKDTLYLDKDDHCFVHVIKAVIMEKP